MVNQAGQRPLLVVWFARAFIDVLRRPTSFFEENRTIPLQPPLIYFFMLLVTQSLFAPFIQTQILKTPLTIDMLPTTFLIAASMIILGTGIMALTTLLAHLFLRALGGRGTFTDTLKVQLFAITPLFLFFIIYAPTLITLSAQARSAIVYTLGITVLSAAANLCRLWITITGLGIMHNITKLRAFVASVILPYALYALVLTIFIVTVYLLTPLDWFSSVI